MTKFREIAKKSGAVYKINQMVLVNTEILEASIVYWLGSIRVLREALTDR